MRSWENSLPDFFSLFVNGIKVITTKNELGYKLPVVSPSIFQGFFKRDYFANVVWERSRLAPRAETLYGKLQ
jgi:hypothetical protein